MGSRSRPLRRNLILMACQIFVFLLQFKICGLGRKIYTIVLTLTLPLYISWVLTSLYLKHSPGWPRWRCCHK
ncbi:hypothetical protein BDR05DRAFT_542604 [Suillus weaverae]|nr:hypothetical protein BDR05DRAFT_542604 [Suillus weaverae]